MFPKTLTAVDMFPWTDFCKRIEIDVSSHVESIALIVRSDT